MTKSKENSLFNSASGTGGAYEAAYLARRFEQISVSLFLKVNEELKLTPTQYAALGAITDYPNSQQLVIAGIIAVDRSTINQVTQRLEKNGLITRKLVKGKIRLNVTSAGKKLLRKLLSNGAEHTDSFLNSLTGPQQKQLMHLMRKVIEGKNQESRTPTEIPNKSSNTEKQVA